MENLLMTPAEVRQTAFTDSDFVRNETITEAQIAAAQQKYLRPVFGKLYDVLGESRYAEFVSGRIKPTLAYYVRSLVLVEMSASVGSLGVTQGKNDFLSPLAARQLHLLRKQARNYADTLIDETVAWVEANPALFPEYDTRENIRHRISLKGGVAV